MTNMITPHLSDSSDYPEHFILILDCGKTDAEKQLSSALWFHLDVLNGGFTQAFLNKRGRVDEVIFSYKKIGIIPAATLINKAHDISRQFLKPKKLRQTEIEALTDVYISMTYNLPYACRNYQYDPEFQTDESDWIIRLALKFARKNIEKIPNFTNALLANES